ncbi:hypothetical protein CYMTET_13333 [Cymbomonas tetramitiformis]|uniref:HAT C-terminal dimerisation domain-containing protein n=1 Tax=Cymbomonas tetramitiformis TaxID=36881 RepID=A0AAE0LB69_9CHLO|nr:hypothetical protein CYMTET_13333 [Cymbomonas tetramitiformis]|eukprot:gene12244-biopygen12592
MTREKALRLLRDAWKADWEPAVTVRVHPATTPTADPAKSNFGEPGFMKRKMVEPVCDTSVDHDQLDLYLSLPQEMNVDGFDVMVWWNAKAKELPDVYNRMARQFVGCPTTTAGDERAFSAAGRMHDDLKKNTGEDTIEHMMLRVKLGP